MHASRAAHVQQLMSHLLGRQQQAGHVQHVSQPNARTWSSRLWQLLSGSCQGKGPEVVDDSPVVQINFISHVPLSMWALSMERDTTLLGAWSM